MDKPTPEEEAADWYKPRKELLMKKYKAGMIEGSLRDAGLIGKTMKQQSELMAQAAIHKRDEPINSLERMLNGTTLSTHEQAVLTAQTRRDEAVTLLSRYAQLRRLENGKEMLDPTYKRLFDLIAPNNDAQWDNLANRIEAESMRQQEIAHNRSLYQLEQTQS
jgi:hypothetical protein